MKKLILAAVLVSSVVAAPLTFASETVYLKKSDTPVFVKDMQQMSMYWVKAQKATNANDTKANLQKMRTASESAKAAVADYVKSDNDAATVKYYQDGMDITIKEIDTAISAIDAGKLTEAKTEIKNMTNNKAVYHTAYHKNHPHHKYTK